jgi:tetratricopeptide (TPR) repeat protein
MAAAVVVTVAAGWVLTEATAMIRADWRSSVARLQLMRWADGRETWTEEQWEQARRELNHALTLTPDDATLHDAMAQLYGLHGQRVWTTGEPGTPEMADFSQALTYQLKSLKVRPVNAYAWANLSLIHYVLNGTPDDVFDAWDQALAQGPHEAQVIRTLQFVAESTWQLAPDYMRDWLSQHNPSYTHDLLLGDELAALALHTPR